jgi:formylglycine-generating enzyme required for sulfatase activity
MIGKINEQNMLMFNKRKVSCEELTYTKFNINAFHKKRFMRTLLLTCITSLLLLSSFSIRKKHKPKLPEEFVNIPAGTFHLYDTAFHLYDTSKRITLSEFYMSKYEVSNLQYRTFFSEASIGLVEVEKEKITPDTSAWSKAVSNNEALTKHYFSNPMFNKFPVVNVSYDAAVKYCEWL